ncbi:MAG: 3,4-dihydroxy-2-butanone-4-phosphate synthase [Actinobacteria bacterium]|nr:3,4-dihydroxy-2-butanone-4-phosphate synthase [Actinomycetota bacterium]
MMQEALTAFKNGAYIIVTDDFDRENEGDLIAPAIFMDAEKMGFMIRHTSGVVCVAMDADRARVLALPPMVSRNEDSKGTAFTVTVDYKEGVTTGISAQERAKTARALANEESEATDFLRPGHIFPLIAHPHGLAGRRGHTEAGVALCQLTGLPRVAVLSELVNEDGSMMRGKQLQEFAQEWNIPTISIAELAESNFPARDVLSFTDISAQSSLPRGGATWKISIVKGAEGDENVLLTLGSDKLENNLPAPLVRIHSECFTGDVLGSTRCECGPQLKSSLAQIEKEGSGVVIYLRGHEGRGIGLLEKIRSYALQDGGLDTVDANLALGHEIDERKWHDAIELLELLHLRKIRLLTNNPEKVIALENAGIQVEIVSLVVGQNRSNARYLASKRDRMGHIIPSDIDLFGKGHTK